MSETPPQVDGGAGRRTSLANERTLLAWWRTALTALAVALGVGRLLPELAPHARRWPFVLIGVAFSLYAVALFVYGTVTSRARESEIGGSEEPKHGTALTALTVSGGALAIATVLLIVTQ